MKLFGYDIGVDIKVTKIGKPSKKYCDYMRYKFVMYLSEQCGKYKKQYIGIDDISNSDFSLPNKPKFFNLKLKRQADIEFETIVNDKLMLPVALVILDKFGEFDEDESKIIASITKNMFNLIKPLKGELLDTDKFENLDLIYSDIASISSYFNMRIYEQERRQEIHQKSEQLFKLKLATHDMLRVRWY